MNIENIKELRDFLNTVPQENFYHGSWLDSKDESDTEFIVEGENVCGTTACVAGWAAILKNLIDYTVDEKGVIHIDWDTENKIESKVQKWLGLNNYEAAVIFYPFDFRYHIDFEFLCHENSTQEEYEAILDTKKLNHGTTITQVVAFLDKVIETEEIHLSYWVDVK